MLRRHQHSHSPAVNSSDNQSLCVTASNGLCTGELGEWGGGGGKVQADKFGLFRCSGKFQDGCVCVRAVEGHASQPRHKQTRKCVKEESWKIPLYHRQMCFFTTARGGEPPPQKNRWFSKVFPHMLSRLHGVFSHGAVSLKLPQPKHNVHVNLSGFLAGGALPFSVRARQRPEEHCCISSLFRLLHKPRNTICGKVLIKTKTARNPVSALLRLICRVSCCQNDSCD